MNEKIKKLTQQALQESNQYVVRSVSTTQVDGYGVVEIPNSFAEKFAELIVRECLNQVDKVDAMLNDDKEKTGVAWVGLAISKHFGVE